MQKTQVGQYKCIYLYILIYKCICLYIYKYMHVLICMFSIYSKYYYSHSTDEVAQWYGIHLSMQETQEMQETHVRSLGREDPLEEEMTTQSSILAWRIPWTEEPVRLQPMELQRVGHN